MLRDFFDRKTCLFLIAVSGVFSLLLTGFLFALTYNHPAPVYFDTHLQALKDEYRADTSKGELREAIRDLDVRVRESYFSVQNRLNTAAWMLFISLSVFLFALRQYLVLKEVLPVPIPMDALAETHQMRWKSFAAMLAIMIPASLGILGGFRWLIETGNVQVAGADGADAQAEPDIPESQRWVQFRGNHGLGYSEDEGLPLTWNVETMENVIWKVPNPAPGFGSPIIWGDRIYLSGGDFDSRKVFCLNRKDGSTIWSCAIRTEATLSEDLKESGDTGLAAPTPVTDGKVVVAFFGTNELVGVDTFGRQIWARWFGEPDSDFGIASSPMIHKNKVYLQLDQGNKEKPHSMLYCIDPANGKSIWEKPREVPSSWSVPLIVNSGSREEVITAGDPWVISYDPENGNEFWRAKVLSGAVAPPPYFHKGFFFTATEFAQLSAIRAGGNGDITETHVAWTYDSDLPDVAGFVADGTRLMLLNGTGKVRCINIENGKRLYSKSHDNGFWSSPTQVKNLAYATDQEGNTFVVRFGDKYDLAAESSFGEKVITSFAIAESRFYVRGVNNLFCLGQKP